VEYKRPVLRGWRPLGLSPQPPYESIHVKGHSHPHWNRGSQVVHGHKLAQILRVMRPRGVHSGPPVTILRGVGDGCHRCGRKELKGVLRWCSGSPM
jgi:hypothetical protein